MRPTHRIRTLKGKALLFGSATDAGSTPHAAIKAASPNLFRALSAVHFSSGRVSWIAMASASPTSVFLASKARAAQVLRVPPTFIGSLSICIQRGIE